MPRDEKNLRDLEKIPTHSVKDTLAFITSYSRTNKLITALYIVTDVMDKEEPLRRKLRTLGADIMSDMSSGAMTSYNLKSTFLRVEEILSFLQLAHTLKLISEMNSAILKKEFLELRDAVYIQIPNPEVVLMDLLEGEGTQGDRSQIQVSQNTTKKTKPINLGMHTAGEFMKVLSNKVPSMSDRNYVSDKHVNFGDLKQKRRDEIIKVIRYKNKLDGNNLGLTITDILTTAKNAKNELQLTVLLAAGEKTLQRELVALVKENILRKNGSKRWSRYSL